MLRRSNSAQLAVVFLVAFIWLAIGVADTGIASGYVDPVTKIAAQDEAVYTHSAIQMAVRGKWLTPVILDRFALYKPPLLYWASALSMKLWGVHRLSIRLPSLLSGALLLTLVFWWARRSWGITAACGTALLLGSSHLFHTMARLNLTDALLTLCFAGAAACVYWDPRLASRRAFFGFAIFSAAAILTKGVAGVMPLLMVAIDWVIRDRSRSYALTLVKAGLCTAALAAPWFLYQLLVHQRWFWAEFVLVENIAFGTGSPPQTSEERQIWFYLRRMLWIDPVLTVTALAAVPVWWKRKGPQASLLVAWVSAVGIALLSYQYRNASYLLPMVVAFSLAAAPLAKSRIFTMALLPVVLLVKLYASGQPWGLPFESGSTLASAAPLQRYCERHRGNELIVVTPDDEFYSSVLPLPRVRYCYIAGPPERQYALDFRHLGIVLTAAEYDALDALRPAFVQRLRQWGVPSGGSIGTVILARSPEEVSALIASHPSSDFLLPTAMIDRAAAASHSVIPATAARAFLLARQVIPATGHEWGCGL
ncbi:MAG: glycosyltransferase family 39 protein [Bryobacteraceae bacterium]